jgi:hypothetical protein
MLDYPSKAFEDAIKDVDNLGEHLIGQFWPPTVGSSQ